VNGSKKIKRTNKGKRQEEEKNKKRKGNVICPQRGARVNEAWWAQPQFPTSNTGGETHQQTVSLGESSRYTTGRQTRLSQRLKKSHEVFGREEKGRPPSVRGGKS